MAKSGHERNGIERGEIGDVNFRMEQLRRQERALELNENITDQERAEARQSIAQRRAELDEQYAVLAERRNELRAELSRYAITMVNMEGKVRNLQFNTLVHGDRKS